MKETPYLICNIRTRCPVCNRECTFQDTITSPKERTDGLKLINGCDHFTGVGKTASVKQLFDQIKQTLGYNLNIRA